MEEPLLSPVAVAAPPVVPASPPPEPQGPLPPWGFWATTGWFALVALVVLMMQLALGIAAALVAIAAVGLSEVEATIADHLGTVTAAVSSITMLAAVAMLALPIRLRRWRFVDYVALHRFGTRVALLALSAVAAFMAAEVAVGAAIDRPIPESMLELRATTQPLPLLWFFVVVVAPVAEEIVFRGFLYRGFAASRIGAWGAIVLTSLLWTATHIQYELYELVWIFLLGLLLGEVRRRTGTAALCILLHAVFNTFAMVVMELYVAGA